MSELNSHTYIQDSRYVPNKYHSIIQAIDNVQHYFLINCFGEKLRIHLNVRAISKVSDKFLFMQWQFIESFSTLVCLM